MVATLFVVCLFGLAVFSLQRGSTHQSFKGDDPLPRQHGNLRQENMDWDWEKMKVEHEEKIKAQQEEFRRKQEDDKAKREDFEKNKLLGREDFVDYISKKVPVPGDLSLRTSDEKHFCRAHEGMEENKYEEIINNLANIMKLNDDDRKDLQLSRFMDSKVNVMERFAEGHYAYLRYQILKTPTGKLQFTQPILRKSPAQITK